MSKQNTFIDHITITVPTLEAGAKMVEDALGIAPQKGGEHLKMGTHNLFLQLGDSAFLEIIAINPNAKNLIDPVGSPLMSLSKMRSQN